MGQRKTQTDRGGQIDKGGMKGQWGTEESIKTKVQRGDNMTKVGQIEKGGKGHCGPNKGIIWCYYQQIW